MCDINPVHQLFAAGTLEVGVYLRTGVCVRVIVLCVNVCVCV